MALRSVDDDEESTISRFSRGRVVDPMASIATRKAAVTVAAGTVLALVVLNAIAVRRANAPPSWAVSPDDASSSATSGKLFSGVAFRTFPVDSVKFDGESLSASGAKSSFASGDNPQCKQWSVVTTIFEPSDAVKKQANLGPDWCIVIVGDRKSPPVYHVEGSSTIVYLDANDQETFGKEFPEFFSTLNWNHFGRKNVGFLYAIAHGAQAIWDFDDDNILKDHADIKVPGEDEDYSVDLPKDHDFPTYNPYVKMGAPHSPSWPRGIPLTHIKDSGSWKSSLQRARVKGRDVALIQSLADHDPDMDAIYRLTMPLPFNFQPPSDAAPIVLPPKTLAPLNAQACLFRRAAFWMLLLPVTVHGRVSDIWRGYAGQRLLWDLGLHVIFSPPIVDQFRNPHSYLADFDSEIPLYTRAGALVEFLHQWSSAATTLPGRVEQLWIALYERGYVEMKDVVLVQHWLQALTDVGYEFPGLPTAQP
ncbi:STELLO glycosyltransferase [Plasmodiophora brassicae]|uniref:Uncharacterized protein n=1 Tax=Plasmodiophora brassicae TaxID=37360 RepID=A0A0G4IGI5_PLABS|nr:hypothetical protein PBRA_000107 [Plasmodiophora brassicae]SPQ96671.1 unnamed protein product [Plasmodiophora brassicae]